MIIIFENELEKGTGVPYILVKNKAIQPSPEIDSILLDNIIKCKAFDPQCEGLRANYMYSIVRLYPNSDKLYAEVLKAFDSMTDTDWGEQQLFEFVSLMANDGLADKKILYEKMKAYISDSKDDLYAMYHFAEKEGLAACEFVARELGRFLESHPSYTLSCYSGFFDYFENKDEVISFLKKSEDKYIKLYMQSLNESAKYVPGKIKSADEIIDSYFSKGKMFRTLFKWIEKADESEVKKIALYALACKNKDLKYRIISRFDEIKMPVDYDVLKSEFKKARKPEHKINVLQALLLFEKPEVKDFVRSLDLNDLEVTELYIKALCIFYDEDEEWLLLEKIDDLGIYSCHGVLKFLIKNENLKAHRSLYKQVLDKLYYKNRCSLCRAHVFDMMAEHDLLDKTICEESMHDCNEYIAKKASEIYDEWKN